MKRKRFGSLGATCVAAAIAGCATPRVEEAVTGQHERRFSRQIETRGALDYLLYVPRKALASDENLPLMLFLHGAGERGNDLNAVKRNGPPMLVEQGKELPFIIASPQCPNGSSWSHPEQLVALNALLDELEETLPVDSRRVYLTGLSMGGFGTWALAAAYPERFAAIAPICGGGSYAGVWTLAKTPIWAFHGAKDAIVPLSESQHMVDALERKGADVKLTIYPETGHDSWVEAYEDPRLYEWLLSHSRD